MKKNKYNFRKVINTIHLWVGVPSALILFVVCLSGTVYVFQKEITRWIDSDKYNVVIPADKNVLPIASLTTLLEKEKKGWKVSGLEIPESAGEAWMFSMSPVESANKKAGANARADKAISKTEVENKERSSANNANKKQATEKGKGRQIKNYLVNPYTGAIQGDAQTTAFTFFNTVMQLHRWLLMDHEIGAVITGTAALLFVLLEITGLILWLPAKLKSWRQRRIWKAGFTVYAKAGWKRINHDLHKAIGFYTFIIITIMGLTGPVMGFEWYKAGFSGVFGVKPVKKGAPGPQSLVPQSQIAQLSAEDLLARSTIVFPYAGNTRLAFPKDSLGSVTVMKTKNGFFASAAVDRLYLDQYNGNTLKLERFSDKTAGEKIVSLVKAIHTGEIFGAFSKLIYFIACLLATSLPVTGTIIWLNKRKKKTKDTKIIVGAEQVTTV